MSNDVKLNVTLNVELTNENLVQFLSERLHKKTNVSFKVIDGMLYKHDMVGRGEWDWVKSEWQDQATIDKIVMKDKLIDQVSKFLGV